MLLLLLQVLWLGLPAAISNIAPAVGTRILPTFLALPVDMNKKFRGKRIFGDHKTFRGLLLGILVGELVFLFQQALPYQTVGHINMLPYHSLPWFFGFLFGIGALGGDMIKSFFKRQLGRDPGKSWFPFDQVDWLVGTLLVLMPFVSIPLRVIVVGLGLGIVLHVIVKFVGYTLGIDSQPL